MCFTKLEKKSDINLVRGKQAVDIVAGIEDLNFVVHPVSRHICRPCLSLLTQRRNHRKKLENLEAKLYSNYCQKARENGMAVKLKHSDKRLITNTATTDKSCVSSMDVVAFGYFYNPSAISDQCTLYADRNLINRRNVVEEVKKNFDACKQFFNLEIEARVVAAALKIL